MEQPPAKLFTVTFNEQEYQEHISLYDRAVQAGRLESALLASIRSPSPELLVATRLHQKFQPVTEPANPGEKDGGNATTLPT